MLRRPWAAWVLVSLVLSVAGFAQQDPPDAAAPAPDNRSDLVVARVSGEPITEKQVLSTIEVLARQTLLKPEQRQQRNSLLFKDALDNLVTLAIIKSEARKQNPAVDQAKVDQQIQQYAGRYASKEEFLKELQSQGVTEAEMRRSIEENLSMQQVLDRVAQDVPSATDQEIQKYYDGNLDKFAVPERAHVAQIFLRKNPGGTLEQQAAARQRLEEIRTEIEAGKIAFADAAVKYSQDSANASKGGDLGLVPRGLMLKELDQALFMTAPGGITPVVESQTGYHLIQVIEIKTAGMKSLEEAKPEIKQILEQVARQRAVQRYIGELKSKAVVETFMTAEEFDKRHPVQ